ncbi:hypothetical protein DL764_006260 [Monosporascus ibericus]|uniref:Ketoreductase (KR) domain-containing protein n=1 Tax=Monosporascus ibericus TaxID=155417 RepID=A0A4Q4T8F4_9PEZI|nr:hypothetical protein DL764_006260 [Monosporascus ibericus]
MSPKGSILITGANGGLGSATVEQILSQPQIAKDNYGIYTVRKVETADAVKKVLRKATSVQHDHELLPLDLASLASARQAAETINKRVQSGEIPPIRALILNAGWQELTTQTYTNDGFDMSFQANFLSHFLLTLLLLKSMDKEHGRIVVISSWSHDTADPRNKIGPYGKGYAPEKYRQIFCEPIDVESLAKGKWSSSLEDSKDPCYGFRRYGASKLCEVMMFRELSYRLPQDPVLSRVAVLSLDPGGMASNLVRRGNRMLWFIMAYIAPILLPVLGPILTRFSPNGTLRTVSKSGGDVLRAAFDTKELGEYPNGLYLNGSEPREVGAEAKDKRKTGQLWRDSLGYAGIEEGDTILAQWE